MELIEAVSILATEHWRAVRRWHKVVVAHAPDQLQRETAQMRYGLERVEQALAAMGVRAVTFDRQEFGPQLPAEPVNLEEFAGEDHLVVADTIEPTIVHDGRIVARGKIVVAKSDAQKEDS
jgi:hypothetical protein